MIALAESLRPVILLVDERKGVNIARQMGFRVTGTLGLPEMATQEGLIDFADAVERLRRTTFRAPLKLLTAMLKEHERKSGEPSSASIDQAFTNPERSHEGMRFVKTAIGTSPGLRHNHS